MKRLLILLLVFGMASVASAGTVYIDGPTSANWGDTITLTIKTTSVFPAVGLYIEDMSDGDFGGTVPSTVAGEGEPHKPLGGVLNASWVNPDIGYLYPDPGISQGHVGYIFGVKEVGTSIAAPATLYTWTYTIQAGSGADTLTFSVTQGSYTGYVTRMDGTVSTDVVPTSWDVTIPEPMTLVLLGLGGLFLRRK